MATLVALFITSLASAAPVRNATQTNLPPEVEPSFVVEPKGRGTLRLLSSCILTLVICVWTAIHPNIIRNPTTRRRLLHKAVYVILGLFSPEIVLAIAFKERRAAGKFLHEAHLAGALAYAQHEIEEATEAMRQLVESRENILESARERIYSARDRVRTAMDDVSVVIASGRGQVDVLAAARKLTTALRQYKTALKNQPAYRRLIEESIETFRGTKVGSFLLPKKASVHEFSWECSFFAVMGGYTFSPLTGTSESGPSKPGRSEPGRSESGPSEPGRSEPGPSELHSSEPGSSRPDSSESAEELALSTKALEVLLQEGIISVADLAKLKDEVTDKGKSNMLAKLLVCIQAVWMMVNCLARKVAGLPITLLELNVVMHVVCAVILYGFWWMKPLDAGRPISLSSKFPKSNGTWELVYTMDKYGSCLRASVEVPAPTSAAPPSDTEKPAPRSSSQEVTTASASKDHPYEDQHRGFILITDTQIMLTKRDLDICATATHALRTLGLTKLVISDEVRNASDEERRHPLHNSDEERRYPLHYSDVEIVSNSTQLITKKTILLLIPLCLIYGGIHASAWDSHFPTPIERQLWRVSCAIVAVPGFGAIAVWFFERSYNRRESLKYLLEKTEGFLKVLFEKAGGLLKDCLLCGGRLFLSLLALGIAGGIVYGIIIGIKRIPRKMLVYVIFEISGIILLVCVAGVAAAIFITSSISITSSIGRKELYVLISVPLTIIYCAARVYIVVESFICLRSLPYGAFKTISWDDVWPHF